MQERKKKQNTKKTQHEILFLLREHNHSKHQINGKLMKISFD